MLPKKIRAKTENFKERPVKVLNSKNIKIFIRKSPDTCFSVVVAKSVSKKAVIRNRIRRRVYASIRACNLEVKTGYSYTIQAINKEFATIPFPEINKEIKNTLKF